MVLEKVSQLLKFQMNKEHVGKTGLVLQSHLLNIVYIQRSFYSVMYLALSMTQSLSPSTGGQELIVTLCILN